MSSPLVSVVVTCYNYGKYLKGCVESVLAQSYPNLELIVVDDGSIDETEEVMASFLGDPRIAYIRQENSGQAVAKNVGIGNSHGEYVAFLDADDLWLPDKLTKEMRCFQNDRIGVAYSAARFIDENGAPVDYVITGRYLMPRSGRVTDFLVFDNFVPFSSAVVRKECFEKIGAFDESLKMAIDWDLWLRVSTLYDFEYLPEALLSYRMGHTGQMSKNKEERQQCCDRIMEKFMTAYPGAVSPARLRKAKAYTACSRAEYYRNIDLARSYMYYMKALRYNPRDTCGYKGIIKNVLRWKS